MYCRIAKHIPNSRKHESKSHRLSEENKAVIVIDSYMENINSLWLSIADNKPKHQGQLKTLCYLEQ